MSGSEGRSSRPILWIAITAYLAITTSYLFVVPAFEAPDEHTHYEYAFHLANVHGLPLIKGTAERLGRSWADEKVQAYHPPLYYAWLAATMHAAGQPDTMATPSQNARFGRWDDPAHCLKFEHGADERWPGSKEMRLLWILRAWSVVFGLIGLVLVHRLGRVAFPATPAVADCAALLVACLPKWNYMMAVINSDNLAMVFANAGVLVLASAVARRRLSVRAGIAFGAVAGIGVVTKLTALFLLPTAAVVYAIQLTRREHRAETLRSGVAAAAVFLVLSGWLFARNQALYGSLMALDVHTSSFSAIQVPPDQRWTWIRDYFTPQILEAFVGHFGWWIIPPTTWAIRIGQLAAAVAALGWIVRLVRRPPDARRGVLLLYAFVVLLVAALTVRYNLMVKGSFARYFFPVIGPLAVLFGAGIVAAVRFVPARGRRWIVEALGEAAEQEGDRVNGVDPDVASVLVLIPPAFAVAVLLCSVRPGLDGELAPAAPHRAALTAGVLASHAAPRLDATAPPGVAPVDSPPTFRWTVPDGAPDDAVYTVHVHDDGRVLFLTYEQGGVEIRDGEYALPALGFAALPVGRPVAWKVRRVPNRARGEGVDDVPESETRVLERTR